MRGEVALYLLLAVAWPQEGGRGMVTIRSQFKMGLYYG